MIEKLLESYKSIFRIFQYLCNDLKGFYKFISEEYELSPLIIFLIQLTILVIAGNELLFASTEGGSQEFSKVWFTFGYIQQAIYCIIFAVYSFIFMKIFSFNGKFTHILKLSFVLFILSQSVTLAFSFLSDLYLYANTSFFESMSTLDHDPFIFIEYEIINFIQNLLSIGFIILTICIFYFSVYKSKYTLLSFALFFVINYFVINPYMSNVWSSYLCKRLVVCAPNSEEMDEALRLFDEAILNGKAIDEAIFPSKNPDD